MLAKSVWQGHTIKIAGYDELQARKVNFTQHFIAESFLDVTPEQLPIARRAIVNVSKPGWLTEFLRLCNTIHFDESRVRPQLQNYGSGSSTI